MTRKEEKELYTITNDDKKGEKYIYWSFIGIIISLSITFLVLIVGKFVGGDATEIISKITFVLFVVTGIFGSLLLFFGLKYSNDDVDYSKYIVVEKEYLKDLEKRAKKK